MGVYDPEIRVMDFIAENNNQGIVTMSVFCVMFVCVRVIFVEIYDLLELELKTLRFITQDNSVHSIISYFFSIDSLVSKLIFQTILVYIIIMIDLLQAYNIAVQSLDVRYDQRTSVGELPELIWAIGKLTWSCPAVSEDVIAQN
eukprot:TRINITY_DN5292_c0_g1_i3.p3 TRINITY_DN5292_c0_g1~~TRINITY_DN5292_c0_g1_i3.p3  ORF type:complete len:144 (+),score=2.14 TRINITY_DN5292_c0_g1_i3:739-1170(+)